MTNIHTDKILILDFGAQYTQLIARRIREIGVYCEIWAWDHDPAEIAAYGAKGIILSGGPESTTVPGAPSAPQVVFDSGLPVLGICYGMQTMAAQLGGATEAGDQREYGHAEVDVVHADALFSGLTDHAGQSRLDVWMSHGDHVTRVPPGFTVTAATDRIPVAAMANEERRWYGVQFHPEVTHTLQGQTLLRRFAVDVCGCATLWTPAQIIEDQIARVREQVGSDEVILGLSGGVDSSVVAALLHRAIGDQLTCVFVDTGLLRWQEGDQVMATFADASDAHGLGIRVIRVDARERYFALSRMGTDWVGNPSLKPSRNTGVEGKASFRRKSLLLEATLYYDHIADYITVVPQARVNPSPGVMNTGARTYRNVTGKIHGGEFLVSWVITRDIFFSTDFSYVRGRQDADPARNIPSTDLAEIPPVRSRTSLRYETGRLMAEIEAVFAGAQRNVNALLGEQHTPGYGTANLKAGMNLKGMVFRIGLNNLFDRAYHEHLSYQRDPFRSGARVFEPGRNVHVNLSYRF